MTPHPHQETASANTLRERAYWGLRDAEAPRSATGKRLSGANARRRLQAHRRAVLLNAFTGPATFEFWVSQPRPVNPQAFDALRNVMRSIAAQCA